MTHAGPSWVWRTFLSPSHWQFPSDTLRLGLVTTLSGSSAVNSSGSLWWKLTMRNDCSTCTTRAPSNTPGRAKVFRLNLTTRAIRASKPKLLLSIQNRCEPSLFSILVPAAHWHFTVLLLRNIVYLKERVRPLGLSAWAVPAGNRLAGLDGSRS